MPESSVARIRALLAKEAAELRAGKGVLVAPLIMLLTAVAVPFLVAIGVPAWSGETLDDAEDMVALARELGRTTPGMDRLSDAGAVQAFLLHQFLPLLLLVPITGAMSLVTTSVVGEKQARSLEPLLATPLTTAEFLAAKIGMAFVVSLTLLATGYALMVGGAAALASPGVAATLVTARPVALVVALAPAVSAVTLVLGVIASARAKDARAAQQFGVVVVLPVIGLFVAQISGQMLLLSRDILLGSAALWALALVLLWVGVVVFDREHILTKWT